MAQKKLLKNGDEIKHDGQSLLIEESLASGLTGEVYKALLSVSGQEKPVSVVVKAMKALDFPLARQLFYKEGETLAFLMHLEEETPDSLADNLKIAPVYYGLSEFQPEPDAQGFPYLVMEFIDGVQVPELLKKGTFSESQALTIAWHLYRILDILHTRLLKTFIDLKFENLWWLENDSKWGGQLKLTDFGTLEEIKPNDEKKRGVARDVLLGGVYLLSMLTCHTLEYSIGELKEHAKPIIDRFEKNITWGTRRLLRKLLHRNIDARFKNAADVLTELRQLVNFWSQSSDRLADMAQKNLALAESAAEQAKTSKQPLSEAGSAAVTRAYSALDILRVKESQLYNERDVQRVKSVLSVGDYFERGYALLQGRSFNLARQTFEEGLSWTDESAFLRRWSYMAAIGEKITPSVFEFEPNRKSREKFLELVNDGQFEIALNSRLPELSQQLQSDGLVWLEEDARMYLDFEEAQKAFASRNFSKSAELYLSALTHLAKLPVHHHNLIKDNELGDITALAEEALKLANSTEKSLALYKQVEDLLENGEIGLVVKTVQDAYEADKAAPFRFERLRELTELALKLVSKNPEYLRLSRHIADVGLHDFGKERDLPYDNICEASAKLELAMQYLSNSNYVDICAKLEEAHALLGEKGSLVEEVAIYAAGRVAQQSLFLNALADSVEKLIPSSAYPAKWREEASKVSEEQFAGRHKQVDELMRQVHYILLPVLPDPNDPKTLGEILRVVAEHSDILGGFDLLELRNRLERLEKSKLLLEKATKLIGEEDEYRHEEISSLYEAVADGLEPARAVGAKQSRMQDEERRTRIFALSEVRIKIHEQLKGLQSPLWDINLEAQKSLSLKLRETLEAFRIRCYQIKAGDPESLQDSVQRQKTLQETGNDIDAVDITVLDIFIRWANRELDALGGEDGKQISDAFKEADADFAKGNPGFMISILDRTQAKWGATPEWKMRKAWVAQASAWKSWCESKSELFQSTKVNADLLHDLRDFARLGLPIVFLEKSPSGQYLEHASDDLRNEIPVAMKTTIHDETFLGMIRDLLNVTWTKQLATFNKERREWKIAEWVQGAYELARNKNARGLVGYISQTPPPENIDDALNSFTYADWERLRLADKRSQDSKAKNNAARQKILLTGGIGLVVCLVLVVAGFFIYRVNKEAISQAISGTYTPTLTLTPTVTFTPTLTPTITLTPTETPTLTPVPPSKFLLRDVGSLYPASPVTGEAYWLMNDLDAVFSPPPGGPEKVWQEAKSQDKNAKSEKFVYTITGNANIVWIMDMPFDAAGYYQIFVLDTQQYSSQPQSFNVFLDQQPVQSYRGTSQVIFQDAQQKTDAWVSLGVYQANAGQTLAVQTALSQLTDKTPFAVDRLLIVRLNEQTRLMLDQLPSGRTLVSLLDDPSARFFEVVQGEPTQVQNRGSFFTDVPCWNGIFSSRLLDQPLTIPVWVEWAPENRLSVGTYEVYVWIPAQHATVVADYFLLADGKGVERPNPATINQKDHAGKWLSLGTWDLPQESMVSLRMVIPAGVAGEIGVDAVAIVKVEQ